VLIGFGGHHGTSISTGHNGRHGGANHNRSEIDDDYNCRRTDR
jgi:hypothetical protein